MVSLSTFVSWVLMEGFDGGRLGELLDDGAALLLLGLEKWFASLQESTRALACT